MKRNVRAKLLCIRLTPPSAGIIGARHHIGPELTGIADRQYIAGVLPNTAANLVRWIRNPTEVDPLTAMPDLDVSEQDARDIAAYLYTQ